MAQAPRQAADRAAFVRAIVSDPKAVPDVMLLYGYLGASSEEDHERLYLSPDLTNYVEVPTSAILHQMAAPKEQDPNGGVTLWVKKDAALIYKMAPAAEALAYFFAGAIQAGAQGAAAAPQPTPAITIAGACTIAGCPTAPCSIACPTRPPHATCADQCTNITPCLNTHAGQATCAVQCTQITPCLQTQLGHATCAVQCTQITPCLQTQLGHATCAVQCTQITPCVQTHLGHATCAVQCTHVPPCLSHVCTNIPACFPTEITPCVATHAPQCTAACGAVGQPQQAAQCFGGSVAPIQTLPCSLLCPTQVVFQCGSQHTPCCPIQTFHGASCAIICNSHQSLCCPVSGGAFCPPVSAFCPGSPVCPGSFVCGAGQPGPVEQAAFAMARGPSAFCTPGCSPVCTGFQCNTPAHPCTPHCPQ
jgi:hypothetical protein